MRYFFHHGGPRNGSPGSIFFNTLSCLAGSIERFLYAKLLVILLQVGGWCVCSWCAQVQAPRARRKIEVSFFIILYFAPVRQASHQTWSLLIFGDADSQQAPQSSYNWFTLNFPSLPFPTLPLLPCEGAVSSHAQVGAGDLHSGPQAFTANTLTHKPSPWLALCFTISFVVGFFFFSLEIWRKTLVISMLPDGHWIKT